MSAYAGTGSLLRLAARRDRIQLPIWILASAGLMSAGTSAVASEFPTEESRVTALKGAGSSAAVLLMRGVPVGTDLGALVNFRNLATILVVVALMNTFLVVRHTRQNEETGRAELIGAGAVGRHAPLTAALLLAVLADIVFGLVMTGTIMSSGLAAEGALAFGAACTVTGLAFAGIAAVAAQLFQGARAANGLAATIVGVAYLVRGVGDAIGERAADGIQVVSAWPTWVSPLGWGELARPYGDERWWVLAVPLALAVACVIASFVLVDRRDLGAGLIPDRPGPAFGYRYLLSPVGLAWRLHRGSTIGWVLGGFVFGLAIGSLGKAVKDALGTNAGVIDMMEGLAGGGGGPDLVKMFFAAMMNTFGALAAGYVIQALLRLRSEEAGGTAEGLLATAVSRTRWIGSHVLVTVIGAAVMLLLAGAGAGITDALAGGDVGIGTLALAGLAQLPGALVVAGFVVLVFGALPRLSVALAWAALVVSIACGLFGDLFGLPQLVRDVSPFTHVPAIPAVDPKALPLLALTGVAVALTAAGMALFRRRDLST
ncbi:ABC transporter permease [Catellatospora bangladeshensis]|uniref:Exporter of polyketide antibiotics n=1 Tax=Catellatospora bangladeshensis TaxID=310355 RepID=A0A8J3NIL0_9ACTN|nr:anibiotic ABC transporter [Catellatospora bangladeshensis]GIF80501.1 exporter of polyketide antibiotics [Catellatospora bangladeshensis]